MRRPLDYVSVDFILEVARAQVLVFLTAAVWSLIFPNEINVKYEGNNISCVITLILLITNGMVKIEKNLKRKVVYLWLANISTLKAVIIQESGIFTRSQNLSRANIVLC